MVFDVKYFQDFLMRLPEFHNECAKVDLWANSAIEEKEKEQETSSSNMRNEQKGGVDSIAEERAQALKDYESKLQVIAKSEEDRRRGLYTKLNRCKEALTRIVFTEKKFLERNTSYDASGKIYPNRGAVNNDIDQFYNLNSETWGIINSLAGVGVKDQKLSKSGVDACAQFYGYASCAKKLLKDEFEQLRSAVFVNAAQVKQECDKVWAEYQRQCELLSQKLDVKQDENDEARHNAAKKQLADLKTHNEKVQGGKRERLEKESDNFTAEFSYDKVYTVYDEIYKVEPIPEEYECVSAKDNPVSVCVASIHYDLSSLNLGSHAITLLETRYPMVYKKGELIMPFSLSFAEGFNHLFEGNQGDRPALVGAARSFAMRLFMMIPPKKVKFTFFDPITLGETFAMFTRLVDIDDRSNEVINEKIWTSTKDIDDRLQVLTAHIANVTQRCLQGIYDNILEYNKKAGQNAEPYQIVMIMDFPGAFKEDSLRMLEQIISTGPKCGVYTVILKNNAVKPDSRLVPLITNIEAKTMRFLVKNNRIVINKNNQQLKDDIYFEIKPMPQDKILEGIIQKLKAGIKGTENIKILFDDKNASILPTENVRLTKSSLSGLTIPIGIRGAKDVQNLSLGGAGSHHALIAGQIGAGKSSLLHTIIMSALLHYPAPELNIFLVDFKRGVEFKIYANHQLPVFRVVAIESEREFGSSVLEYLDKEQERRSEKFKRINVDDISLYREKKPDDMMPRILLIIDEFHILFSKDNDSMSKNAAAHLEQIIRQGRAFGIHVILASQTMANIGGISPGVWGQVGVRIALKCPRADARFILGPDNDGVDLLAPNDPGQAVYNSECGNSAANSIFRVSYIEQEKQAEILAQISEQSRKKSANLNLPETRVMLSNVEDNIYNRFQKFARGEPPSFKENGILVGESLQLINTLRMTFKDRENSNMLIIGNNDQKARTMFTFCALSLILHSITMNNGKRPSRPAVYILDYAPLETFGEKDILVEFVKALPENVYVKYETSEDSREILKELNEEVKNRKKNNPAKENTYFFLFGLQRARDLRNNDPYQGQKQKGNSIDDDFGLDIQKKPSGDTPYEMFKNILLDGASQGVHSIIWEDNFKTFAAHYPGWLSMFELRIAFTMPDDDSVQFIEEPNGSQISENNAVFSYNGNKKFRPYKKPDAEWLRKICKRISDLQ